VNEMHACMMDALRTKFNQNLSKESKRYTSWKFSESSSLYKKNCLHGM